MDQLWSSLSFNNEPGSLSPTLLEVQRQPRTHEEVKAKLIDEVLGKMERQKAWLGTPRADQTEELHRWYSIQLDNFETIIKKKRQNPNELAGYLISIATPCFEGRCGSAYQIEIQQKRDLSEDNINLNLFVKRAATNSLLSIIEKIVREKFKGDSHAMNQFSYAAGISSVPDPLPPITVEEAQQKILKAWTIDDFLQEFAHGVEREIAIEWLKLQTPAEFGPEYKKLEKAIEADETVLLDELRSELKHTFNEEEAAKLEKQFLTLPMLTIPLQGVQGAGKEELFKTAISEMLKNLQGVVKPGTLLPSSAELIQKMLAASTQQKHEETLKELVQQVVATAKQGLDKSSMPTYLTNLRRVTNLGDSLVKELLAIVQLDTKLAQLQIKPSIKILEMRQKYGSRISEIGKKLEDDDLPVTYSPTVHALPSQAIENARRLAYNKDHLEGSYKKMLLHILSEIGAIQ